MQEDNFESMQITQEVGLLAGIGNEVWHSVLTIISAVVVDFLLVGFAIATAGWYASVSFIGKNHYLLHFIQY